MVMPHPSLDHVGESAAPRGKCRLHRCVWGVLAGLSLDAQAWGMPSRVFAVSYIVLAALLWGLKGGLLVALVNIPVV